VPEPIPREIWRDPRQKLEHHELTGTKGLIVDAARRFMMQHGLRRLTMQGVADVAQLSRAAVYLHYSDRDALVEKVLEWSIINYTAMLRTAIDEHKLLSEKVVAAVAVARAAYDAGEESAWLNDIRGPLYSVESDKILVAIMNAVMPSVAASAKSGELRQGLPIATAAEWIARAVHSIGVSPGVTFASKDPRDVERFVRLAVIPGLVNPE